MNYRLERLVLILLTGTALTACAANPKYAINPPVIAVPPPVAPAPQLAQAEPAAAAKPAGMVESRELAALPQPAPAAPAPAAPRPAPADALAQAESAPVVAFEAPGVDAAARAKSRRAGPSSTYKVRKGDTLAEIADRLGTDIPTLAKANGLKKPYRLTPGQVLKNPKAKGEAETAASGSSSSGRGGRSAARETPETHAVKSGDTLYSIAKRYGTTVEALRAENHLSKRASLKRGQTLRLPGAGGAAAEEAAPEERTTPSRSRGRAEAAAESDGRAAQGRVVTIDVPGKAYKVRRGDTLEKVAGRLDSDVGELARINKLKKPYHLRAGQTLRGPGGTAKAYVVARGDTLGSIAQRFDVSVEKLRAANGLSRRAGVAPGRKLRLPAGYRDRGPGEARPPEREAPPAYRPPPPQPIPPSSSEALPSRPQPYSGRPTSPSGGPVAAPSSAPALSDAQIMQLGRGVFAWPLQGEVMAGFGARGAGQRNDGIDIRAQAGDAVRAAAAGDVVYAGDQVPGFGNLVLIKHADGWVTAYGHLGRVDVRMQQKVSQGQQIGQAGTTGGVTEPQLHFEVRYAPSPQERARPVDPQLVLPK